MKTILYAVAFVDFVMSQIFFWGGDYDRATFWAVMAIAAYVVARHDHP